MGSKQSLRLAYLLPFPLRCPLLPIPGLRTRHVGRPRTRLGPLPHWLTAQPPASPWGPGKSPLFTPCCGVSCTGGAGWGWRAPPPQPVFQLASAPNLGPCCSGPMGLPSVCLSHPSRASEGGLVGRGLQGTQAGSGRGLRVCMEVLPSGFGGSPEVF